MYLLVVTSPKGNIVSYVGTVGTLKSLSAQQRGYAGHESLAPRSTVEMSWSLFVITCKLKAEGTCG
jgi:hypothetical protein